MRGPPTLALVVAVSAGVSLLACPAPLTSSNNPGGTTILGGSHDSGVHGTSDAGGCGFSAEVFYPAENTLTALATGDLNGDGRADVVAAGGSLLRVWHARADGGLIGPDNYSTLGSTVGVTIGRFDDDLYPDVVVADGQPQNATQLFSGLGDADAGLLPPLIGPGRPYVQSIVAADFDGDGREDLALANDAVVAGEVYLLLNPPSQPQPFFGQHLLDATRRRAGIGTDDFSGDGLADLVATDPLNGQLTLYLGQGGGTFAVGPTVDAGAGPSALATGDVNGDGLPDILTVCSSDSSLGLVAGADAGTGVPTLAVGIRIPSVAGHPVAVATGDWTNVGHPGAVTAETAPAALGLYVANGGALGGAGSVTPSSDPRAVSFADVDGDGALDIVALLDGGVGVYRGNCR